MRDPRIVFFRAVRLVSACERADEEEEAGVKVEMCSKRRNIKSRYLRVVKDFHFQLFIGATRPGLD